jgi:mRNA interferase MazF
VPKPHEPVMGEVWDVDFSPHVGREQGGIRPALVISNDVFNRLPNGLYFVVPITGTDRGLRLHVRIAPPEGGLAKPSVIMCDQGRVQSDIRFLRRRGSVSEDVLRRVQELVGESINR